MLDHTASALQQLPDEVASYVRQMILAGKVRPGEFVRIERIAEAVGVSTTPVREGLLKLCGEGFVKTVPRRGYVVAPFTKQDVRDLFWAHALLAGELASRAAENITHTDLDELATILRDHQKAIAHGDADDVAALGHAFHRRVNAAAGSPRLVRLLDSVTANLPNLYDARPEPHLSTTQEARLLAALRKRAATLAKTLMETHILDGADHMIAELDRRGLWNDVSEAPPNGASTANEAVSTPTIRRGGVAARPRRPR
ncbi:GntR family transcriptional regulator [Rhodococcus sp. NPDC059968]|uniref:GntR family transcriptional regulator n=1 Tax=Rhodococcus sp. NPDC059968 TaxID=3347017 RepID=UPI0036711EC6